jgi:MFS family permease
MASLGPTWNVTNIGAIAPVVATAYGTTLGTVGLLTAILLATQLALTMPIGRLVDRFGAKRAGAAGLGIAIVANLCALTAPELAIAFSARAAMGVAMAIGFIAGTRYVQAGGGSPLAQGVFGAVSLGMAGGAPLAIVPLVAEQVGWRAPYLTGGVVAALCLAILALCPTTRGRPGHSLDRPMALVRAPLIRRLGLVNVTSFSVSVLIGNWVVTLLVRDGYEPATAGAIGALTLAGGIVSRPGGGWLATRWPGATRWIIAGGMICGGCATIQLAGWAASPLTVPATAVVGLASGLPFAAILDATAKSFPHTPGSALGAMNLYPLSAVVIVNPLLGLAFDLPGGDRLAFAALGALWIVAILAIPARAVFLERPSGSVAHALPEHG